MIRVFGLHDAVKHAEATMLQRIKLSCSAQDDPMSVTAHSDWGGASDAIRRQLDKKCKEPRVLHFYPNALYEMTYNDLALGFSQSQIAMLQEMPTVEEIRSYLAVRLYQKEWSSPMIYCIMAGGWYLLVRLEGP